MEQPAQSQPANASTEGPPDDNAREREARKVNHANQMMVARLQHICYDLQVCVNRCNDIGMTEQGTRLRQIMHELNETKTRISHA